MSKRQSRKARQLAGLVPTPRSRIETESSLLRLFDLLERNARDIKRFARVYRQSGGKRRIIKAWPAYRRLLAFGQRTMNKLRKEIELYPIGHRSGLEERLELIRVERSSLIADISANRLQALTKNASKAPRDRAIPK
jgi:hypothetical protein